MHKTIDLFGEFATFGFLLVGDKDGNTLLTPDNINKLYELYKIPTYNLSAKSDKQEWDFNQLCERPYPGFPQCSSDQTSLFSLFNNNKTLWSDQSTINQYIATTEGQEILNVCSTL